MSSPLLERLKLADPRARLLAVQEIARQPLPDHGEALHLALADGEFEIRKTAVLTLGKLANRAAIEQLVPLLLDNHDFVRQVTEMTLAKLDPNWEQSGEARLALPVLEAATQHADFWMRQAATEILKKVARHKADELGFQQTSFTDRNYYRRRDAARILATVLKDPDMDLRLIAAEGIGRAGHPFFTETLVTALTDPDEWVRWHAARSLLMLNWNPEDDRQKSAMATILRNWDEAARLGIPAVDPLLLALKSANGEVREAAATTLGQIRDPRSEKGLADCLQDPQKAVRRAVAKALAGISTRNLTPSQKAQIAIEMKD